VTENPAPRGWWIAFLTAFTFTGVLGLGPSATCSGRGIGVWGNNSPVGWAWDITNFVWWVGIGHAGTLISAVLFLFRQKWRTSINRFAEAMTIFAVICASSSRASTSAASGSIYYMFPLPNRWRSGRTSRARCSGTCSRSAPTSRSRRSSGTSASSPTSRPCATARRTSCAARSTASRLGWRGSNRHWQNYERAYLILAALSTPLVLSVHSVVSFDFATSVEPGWHTTIFPPYFVAGAVFSGFAMVLTLLLIARAVFGCTSSSR
jgi:Ni/Fe-hydrogenase subunit HybB-like protein